MMTASAWEGESGEGGIKTCPRCGARLFADMDVCYGCLYDFTKEGRRPPEVEAVDPAVVASTPLDEPPLELRDVGGAINTPETVGREKRPGDVAASPAMGEDLPFDRCQGRGGDVAGPPRRSSPSLVDALPAAPSGVGASADDSPDSFPGPEIASLEPVAKLARPTHVRIVMGGLAMSVGVPEEGLTVGRDRSCGLVLDCSSVSPQQLAIRREGDGMCAQDLGASNPALLNGWALSGACSLRVGDRLEVRESGLSIYPICPAGFGDEQA